MTTSYGGAKSAERVFSTEWERSLVAGALSRRQNRNILCNVYFVWADTPGNWLFYVYCLDTPVCHYIF